MKRNFKKVCAAILTACLVGSAVNTTAAEWKIAYPTEPNGSITYWQTDENGNPTGISFTPEERWVAVYWEKEEPHRIFQKQQLRFPGSEWFASPQSSIRPSGFNEIVKHSEEQVFVDINQLIGWGEPGVNVWHAYPGDCAERHDSRVIEIENTKEQMEAVKKVPKLYQKRLTGTYFPVTVVDDTDTAYGLVTGSEYATAEWVPGGYEPVYPYRLYYYLSLDGYVMDGTWMTIPGDATFGLPTVRMQKPYIFRYALTY